MPRPPKTDNYLKNLANKALGQHFLHDPRVLGRIVDAVAATGMPVIEIGPGTGALTKPLLAKGFAVDVVEKDARWRALMLELAQAGQPVRLLGDDALTLDWRLYLQPGQWVVGNLPYNVGTEIVAELVTLAARGGPLAGGLVFMLQKEVVQRIAAKPGGGDWGRLGVLCDLMSARAVLFDVAPGAFNPPPKVMSSVVRLTPLPRPRFDVDLHTLEAVLRQSFGQRRKMLRASLRGVLEDSTIAALGIDPTRRPETLTTEEFCRLANALAKR